MSEASPFEPSRFFKDAVLSARYDLERGWIDAIGYAARLEQAAEAERMLYKLPEPILVPEHLKKWLAENA